ncbi:MAG: excinuclease ABC subunit UvrC [Bacteroidales bacterium]|nr:excinuclease ABC subunit UvrC [Bacteroidales bacterium]
MNKYFDQLEPVIKTLPDKPGIYQYFDVKGKILYIGKAKSLRKRVSSYFTKDKDSSGKLRVLISKIFSIEHIVVETELDALLLENNLIKKYQPRYNIQLKDDKTFPWICIRNEPFPRIFSTRIITRDHSEFFGPFASVRMMNTLLDLIRQLYPLRTCKYNLSEDNIRKRKYKVCLQYHLGNCLGPCEGKQTEEEYNQTIRIIRDIIRGNIREVIQNLKGLMNQYADNMEFEKAQAVKEKLGLLLKYQSKSTVVNPKIRNVDIFSLVKEDNEAFVNYIKVIDGAIVQSHTVELRKKLDESEKELLTMAVIDLRQRFNSKTREIILPLKIDPVFENIRYTIPQRGDKKQLLELSERNCRLYRLEKQKQAELTDPERHTKRILNTIMKDLRMKDLPRHIECFDNSNFQGDYPVAAMVCFTNAKPDKKEYRHFNIKTVEGPDDYGSMEEIIFRRYKRLTEENKPIPQLIVIDGGKGQLNSAIKSLGKIGLETGITIIGLAKRLEEIYFPGDPVPLYLDKKSETLKILQYLRNEAHRFGITHHRKKRIKGTLKSELTEVKGIGIELSKKLLYKFKSVKKIKNASLSELEFCIGKSKAKLVFDHFRQKGKS